MVGPARAGGARRLGARPGPRRVARSSRRWRRGRSGRWRSSRRCTPGWRRSAWAERRPRPAGDRPAQLRGGGAGGRAGLPPRPALARAGAGPGRGRPDRLQPQPADPDAAGDADDAGAGRARWRSCSATAGTSGSGPSRRAALGLGRAGLLGGPGGPGAGPVADGGRRRSA